ncbi:MAG: LamG-like jellyroll fold domain-containing protein [Pseudomonadota bacterium]
MKKAFTLTELSIVVLVIGVLITGITQGSGMIKTARLANARSMTSRSPTLDISGLTAWYEPTLKSSFKDSESIDASQTTEWRDNSPGSIVLTKNKLSRSAGSDVVYKESGINNLPTLLFSGASSANIALANFYQGTSLQNTIFLVFRPLFATSSTAITLLDSSSSNSTSSVSIKSTAVNLNAGTSADTGTGTNAASFANGNDYIVAAYFNSSSSQVFVNNAATSAGSATINPNTNQLGGLTIGTNKSGTSGFNGYISEIIVFNRPLKLQERKDVMSYLSKKYKISVTGL